ncbi:MAG: Na+/H+ antiporter subunit E [Lachnospiraceae bacterium]|nr:Na+/H+ antiporter subunit E [Lachnospiraceae bacterium]
MYLLFFLIWVNLNGKFTVEITVLGLIIAAVIYAFICKFMDFSFQKDIFICKRTGQIIHYIVVLVKEIIKANIDVLKIMLSSKYDFEPAIIRFKTTLKSKTARVVLANSITLTPGTITVSLEEDKYVIHCLDKDFGKGIENSVFVKLLEKMEADADMIKDSTTTKAVKEGSNNE